MRLVRAWGPGVGGGAVGAVWIVLGLGGCGVLGPPVPPENVGVAPVIERQLRREGLLAPGANVWGSASRPSAPSAVIVEEALAPSEPDALPTPPVRMMGTR